MTVGEIESDGPEDRWARAHEHVLVGLTDEDATAMVTAAGFRPFIFRPAAGRALAAMKPRGSVQLTSSDGVVRAVRR